MLAWLTASVAAVLAPGTIRAQSAALSPTAARHSAAFVMTLGRDTVQVESFARIDSAVTGLLAYRLGGIRIVQWSAVLDRHGQLRSYQQRITDGDGRTLTPDPGPASMTWSGDTVVREARQRDGTMAVQRVATPNGAWPIGTIPISASFALFEMALAPLRLLTRTDSTMLYRLMASAAQGAVSRTRVLFTSPDSVHVDYFGQGRSRFLFDAAGQLQRSDWRQTTYDVRVERVPSIDVAAIAAAWARAERAGAATGPLSPRDSLTARVGAATIAINYSRPLRRGRVIWGGVVPWDTVWRLGADMATQMRLDAPLRFGDSVVPAGEYTLWMQTSATRCELVISSLVRVFGTQYDRRRDVVRIPMERTHQKEQIEQLWLTVSGGALRVLWGDAEYRVPLSTPGS
jgi:hypothetical protein